MRDTRVTPPGEPAAATPPEDHHKIRIPGSDDAYHTNPTQILAQCDSQRAPYGPVSASIPTACPQTSATGKAPTVRLRLHDTPAEIAATVTALAEVLDIHTVSRTYPDRPSSRLCRVYLDAAPRPARPSA